MIAADLESPRIKIKFYENINDWDATGLAVHFDLYVYIKLNVGSYITRYNLTVPNSPFLMGSSPPESAGYVRIYRSRTPEKSYPSNQLGATTRQAIDMCRRASPNGANVSDPLPFDMPVRLTVIAFRLNSEFTPLIFERTIPVEIECQSSTRSRTGKAPAGPTRKKRFAVTGGSLDVVKHGRDCPRLIATRVTLKANKEGKAKYVLRRSNGPDFKRTMLIFNKHGQAYKASVDHQFDVGRSKTVRLWVEHKGRKLTKVRKVRVDCSKPYEPKGVYVE